MRWAAAASKRLRRTGGQRLSRPLRRWSPGEVVTGLLSRTMAAAG
jgi:hypothetical protein